MKRSEKEKRQIERFRRVWLAERSGKGLPNSIYSKFLLLLLVLYLVYYLILMLK